MLRLKDYAGKPCSSSADFEFVPREETSMDLEAAAKKLRKNEVFVEIETPFLLMLKIAGRNLSLYKSGKILVKSTHEKEEARKAAEKLVAALNR